MSTCLKCVLEMILLSCVVREMSKKSIVSDDIVPVSVIPKLFEFR